MKKAREVTTSGVRITEVEIFVEERQRWEGKTRERLDQGKTSYYP